MAFGQVTIIGVGLLGASLGMALKRRSLAARVVGVGRSGSPSLQVALQRGAIDVATENPADGSAASDLLVLCTPVGMFPAMLRAISPALRDGAIVTDVGSTKTQVMAWARDLLPPRVAFIGAHPMAGSEKTGPSAAREDLFEGALCLICGATGAVSGATPGATEAIEALWRGVGMRTVRVDPLEHDRWVASVSHLPHAAAFSLAAAVGRHPEAYIAAAGSFSDTTRVASSDPQMWTDIFLTNREPVVAAIDALAEELAALRSAIAAGDAAAIKARLEAARQIREDVLARRKAGPP